MMFLKQRQWLRRALYWNNEASVLHQSHETIPRMEKINSQKELQEMLFILFCYLCLLEIHLDTYLGHVVG